MVCCPFFDTESSLWWLCSVVWLHLQDETQHYTRNDGQICKSRPHTTQKFNSNTLIIAWDQTWSQMNFLIKWAPIRIKKKAGFITAHWDIMHLNSSDSYQTSTHMHVHFSDTSSGCVLNWILVHCLVHTAQYILSSMEARFCPE